MSSRIQKLLIVMLLLVSEGRGALAQSVSTKAHQSPAINQSGNNLTTNINYGIERVGEKIAIRSAYLIPLYLFEKDQCPDSHTCGDFYETASLYAEVQSIWPEPILLTAAHIEFQGLKSKRSMPGGEGQETLGERITKLWNPEFFLLRPGEIKTIHFGKGLRLDGLMDFFSGDIVSEPILCISAPCLLHNLNRVKELNLFMAQRYGKKTTLKLTLYEKDYRPLLTTSFRLADGADMFDYGDSRSGHYKLQHDKFIAEVLYVLQGGGEYFDRRRPDRNHKNPSKGQ